MKTDIPSSGGVPWFNAHTRRQFLAASGLGVAGVLFGTGMASVLQGAAPQLKLRDLRVISQQPQYYHGWPTLARVGKDGLAVVYSGGREEHVCPFGRVELIRSSDRGETWTWPRVLLDSDIDDRDAGILETARGSWLVTTFTSLAYEASLLRGGKKGNPQWLAAHNRLNAAQRQSELGQWMIRSADGGVTWSARYSSLVNSPHGPIQLADGRLLYAGRELWTGQKRIGVCESKDDGQTWQWLSDIPVRAGDRRDDYHELHAAEAKDGRIVIQIRKENPPSQNETLQCESADGGRTWSVPRAIGVWGLPSFLTRLRDGRLLMTYGHRRAPLGNQARISEDHGRTWSEALIISGDGTSGDLGYPSTVELENGLLVTVWYERMKDSPQAVLRQARWTLER
jgi:sialidase-1